MYKVLSRTSGARAQGCRTRGHVWRALADICRACFWSPSTTFECKEVSPRASWRLSDFRYTKSRQTSLCHVWSADGFLSPKCRSTVLWIPSGASMCIQRQFVFESSGLCGLLSSYRGAHRTRKLVVMNRLLLAAYLSPVITHGYNL